MSCLRKANVNDDDTPKKLESEVFLASAREIWEQTLPEGVTVEMAAKVHLHDQDFSQKFSRAVAARTFDTGKESKISIANGVEAVETLELPGNVFIKANAFSVLTPKLDYLVGYTDLYLPCENKAGAIIDKNNPGNLWDF